MFDFSKWDYFKISDLFAIETGKDLIMNTLNNGNYPIVGHSNKNNGIVNFCEFLDDYPLFNCKKTISLADRGTFKAYVQPYDYYIATRVKVLIAKYEDISVNSLFFIASIINLEEYKFRYGRNATDKIPGIKILLPSINNQPDYEFMHSYIDTLKIKKIEKKFLDNKSIKNVIALSNLNSWVEFKMIDIFEVKRGHRLTEEDRIKGALCFVTAGENDNGVSNFIGNEVEIFENKLTIDMFGNCFFHSYPFGCDDNILVLFPKQSGFSKEVNLFFATLLNQEKFRYRFGRQYRQKDFEKHMIKLPAKQENGEFKPDFEFMSDYIKNLKYSEFI
ncbi:restriction endonuclease subunit S [Helicobacter sp. 23-1046]